MTNFTITATPSISADMQVLTIKVEIDSGTGFKTKMDPQHFSLSEVCAAGVHPNDLARELAEATRLGLVQSFQHALRRLADRAEERRESRRWEGLTEALANANRLKARP